MAAIQSKQYITYYCAMKRSECFRVLPSLRWVASPSVSVGTCIIRMLSKASLKAKKRPVRNVLAKSSSGCPVGQKNVACTGFQEEKTLMYRLGERPASVNILMRSISPTHRLDAWNAPNAFASIRTLPVFRVIKSGRIMRPCLKRRRKGFNWAKQWAKGSYPWPRIKIFRRWSSFKLGVLE